MTKKRNRPPVAQRTALLAMIATNVAIIAGIAAGLVTNAQTHQLLAALASSVGVGAVAFLSTYAKLDKFIE